MSIHESALVDQMAKFMNLRVEQLPHRQKYKNNTI